MRIAVLASSYPRFPGDGAAPFVQSLARALAKQGHQVEVVAPFDADVRPSPTETNLRVRRFRYVWPAHFHIMGHARSLENDERLRPLALLLLLPFLVMAILTLLWTVLSRRSEVIHAHWVLPNGLVAAVVSWLTGVPFVLSLHGSDIFVARRVRAFGFVAGWVLRRAAGSTACSPELRDTAIALGASAKVVLLPWGADPVVFRRGERNGGPPVVVALGRLVAKKGFDVLLDAWPAVEMAAPGARLRIGGDGALREELARRNARVELTGQVAWDGVPRFLGEADVFVLPSRRDAKGNVDGLPTVLLEAMSCGAAVVASDIGGVALVVQNGQNGVLVPPGDAPALADALVGLVCDPQRRDALGTAARRSVEERLNWDAVAGELAALLQHAKGRNRRVKPPTGVPPGAYDREYYLVHMDGATDFARSGGEALTPRLDYALQLVKRAPGQRILDLGCGRGEVAWHVARSGAEAHGADFSPAALGIAHDLAGNAGSTLRLEAASATHLPYREESFDAVLMLDIVEHLYPEELLATFREVLRVLKPRGRLVVHTMPNADYYRWGYPVYRQVGRLAGRSMPKDPRKRWYRGETHVNIQSPRSLRRTLDEAGFPVIDVWLHPLTGGRLANLLGTPPLLRRVLCNDVLAVAEKR